MYKHNTEFSYHRRKSIEYDCVISTENITSVFSDCGDFQLRTVDIGLEHSFFVSVVWLDGTVSGGDIAEQIIRPLTEAARFDGADVQSSVRNIAAGAVYSCSIRERRSMDSLVSDICHGCCAVIIDTQLLALSFEAKTDKNRAVSEPTLEKSIKGAKDSFTEVLRVNTALVRRRISDPRLKISERSLGRRTHTSVSLVYFEGIASPDTVRETAVRLDSIDLDAVLSVGDIEKYIVDCPASPFPQLMHTERPDRFAMYLLDGRIGILIDGVPVGLVLPVTFAEFMKVIGDRSMHHTLSTLFTCLRYLSILLSALLPAVYIAIAMYHQEMIPTKLLMSIVDAKKNVPFSSAMEVLGMLLAFAMLQEAGLRLPDPVGNTVSIIGALIVGQSAVEARIVSPIAIIVVAVSGIACYTLPSQDMAGALRLSRLLLLLAGIIAGMYGVVICFFLILLHLSSIESFGLNYTAPLSSGGGIARLLIRPPAQKDKFRDPLLNTPDKRRQK